MPMFLTFISASGTPANPTRERAALAKNNARRSLGGPRTRHSTPLAQRGEWEKEVPGQACRATMKESAKGFYVVVTRETCAASGYAPQGLLLEGNER